MAKVRFTTLQLSDKLRSKLQSCEKRKIPFKLTLTQYERLMKTRKCFYTGVPMNGDKDSPYCVTLDRKNPDLPYTNENTVACCKMANDIKNKVFERPGGSKPSLLDVINLCNKLIEIDFKPRA